MSDGISRADYWNEIERIVADAVAEAAGDEYRASDLIFENVDSHSWTIYYSKNHAVLEYTENEDAASEYGGLDEALKAGGVAKVIMVCAFAAMRADCMSRLTDVLDAWQEKQDKIQAAEDAENAREESEAQENA